MFTDNSLWISRLFSDNLPACDGAWMLQDWETEFIYLTNISGLCSLVLQKGYEPCCFGSDTLEEAVHMYFDLVVENRTDEVPT